MSERGTASALEGIHPLDIIAAQHEYANKVKKLQGDIAERDARIAELERDSKMAHAELLDAESELARLRDNVSELRDDLRERAEREGGLFAHFHDRTKRMLAKEAKCDPD